MATKKKIIQVSLKHFAQKGYENTTLEEIAKELNITKPAIYYHFKNKKNLYNEIFKEYFEKLKFHTKESLEENVKNYVYTLGNFFIKNPDIAKLFSKEITSEGVHLNEDTLKTISKTMKHLAFILRGTGLNAMYIQTLVVSTFTTYANTLKLREKISGLLKQDNLVADFNITEEIFLSVKEYIKAHR